MKDTWTLCGRTTISCYKSELHGTVVIIANSDTDENRITLIGEDADKFMKNMFECFD